MEIEEKKMLLMMAHTQHIIIEQLNSIIDVLSDKLNIPIEDGTLKDITEVGEE